MAGIRTELIDFGRSQIGSPFKHHFVPNLCDGGNITLPVCMESGMDQDGYDCMGLVIAGMCKIMDIETTEWPWEFRHNLQLYKLAADTHPKEGDIVLIESVSETSGTQYSTHSGIYIDRESVIHANGRSKIVDESKVMGVVTRTTTIEPDFLLKSINTLRAC